MSGLITALNIAYEEKETRGFFKLNLIALGLTLGLLAGGVVAIALVAVLPAAARLLAIGAATKWLLLLAQWPLLIVLVMLGLGGAVSLRVLTGTNRSGDGSHPAPPQRRFYGSSLPSPSPSMSPISTVMTKPTDRWAASSFS